MAWKLLYKIIDTEDKKKQLAAKRRGLSKAKKRIAEIDTLIQKICDTRAAPGHLPYGGARWDIPFVLAGGGGAWYTRIKRSRP